MRLIYFLDVKENFADGELRRSNAFFHAEVYDSRKYCESLRGRQIVILGQDMRLEILHISRKYVSQLCNLC